MPHPHPGQEWKHGWVPVTTAAAASKNHGKKPGKHNLLSRITAEATAVHKKQVGPQSAAKSAVKLPVMPTTKAAPPKPAPKAATPTAKPAAPQTKKTPTKHTAKPQAAPASTTGMRAATRHQADEEGMAWLNKKMPTPKLAASETSALQGYAGDDYKAINGALRNPGQARTPKTRRSIDDIDAAIAKSTVPEDVIVHRGVDKDFAQFLGADVTDPASMEALVGKVSREDGYVSTSAGAQAHYKLDIAVMMHVPKGHEALNLAPLNEWGEEERELLLARGTRMVFHAAYKRGSRWYLEAEVVPEGWQKPAGWTPDAYGDANANYDW